uniref:Troponin T n=1 Tax=Parascaris univalens TaxID=6257 RepID=A0A915BXT2_PARUN
MKCTYESTTMAEDGKIASKSEDQYSYISAKKPICNAHATTLIQKISWI